MTLLSFVRVKNIQRNRNLVLKSKRVCDKLSLNNFSANTRRWEHI